jgi:hypothetical protein
MRYIYFDIETIPRPESELLEMMPPEVANPVLPPELAECPDTDLSKCPAYGGDTGKQFAWKQKARTDTLAKWNASREDWQMKAMDAKAKFIGDAALHAERGQVKLMSFREKGLTTCLVVSNAEESNAIAAEKTWPCKVRFEICQSESALLLSFNEVVASCGPRDGGKLVGYYIAGFDFPFSLRREMILGVPLAKELIKNPRYLNDDYYIDIRDCWTMGDKQAHTGGLDGLAKILGIKRKTGDGANFWKMWRDNPVDAINYNLNELDTIEEVAKRVGASQ